MDEKPQDNRSKKTLQDFAAEAAKSYMRFAVYIDDKIYTEGDDEIRFWNSPSELIGLFAENSIALTAYECCSNGQFESAVGLIKMADIAIIDWEMYVEGEDKIAKGEPEQTVTLENLSKRIFEELIRLRSIGEFAGPRLICIYTKAPDKAAAALQGVQGIEKRHEGLYTLSGGMLRFCIVNKDPNSNQVVLMDEACKTIPAVHCELKEDDTASSPITSDDEESGLCSKRQIGKEEFVPFLVQQFAQIHRGILPVLTLKVIGAVRDLMPRMMNNFSEKCDNAVIIETALQPCPEYALRQAIDAILGYFASALKYDDDYVGYIKELVTAWVHEHKFGDSKAIFTEHGITFENIDEHTNGEICLRWLADGYPIFLRNVVKLSKEQLRKLTHDSQKFIHLVETIFGADGSRDNISNICRQYSRLCHYRAACKDIKKPSAVILSLGSVVKFDGDVYMCVQQECDSVRVTKDEGRPFLFVPLKKAQNGKSEVVVGEEFYCVDPHPYNLRSWKFRPMSAQGEIRGEEKNGRIVFYGEELNKDAIKEEVNKILEFEWLFDLKDRIALKIADDMSRQFARVAIDSSEWLRLKSKDAAPIEQEPCIP